ncbi:EamA family transporter RarD [Pasteurella bettyae]|uniref:Protein RarD n=1 Tax=Pasteurella bettyae CCUG 2042 TaxID=1095749 RepID=I3DDC2_9PAST|nr:EamA family transporter RarD [Pasteurella bettyae]EIJ69715.1 protein RarD [Pasteurella bettyae CCUG 2042]SUB22018.1 putative transporter [Pasteurella bettyae]
MIRGIIYSIISSLLFGGVYFLATLIQPVSGEGLYGLRLFVTTPFVILALILLNQQKEFVLLLKRLVTEPLLIIIVLITATSMGIQMWLYLWAPNNGKAIDVSIGYLLMPLVMVLFGKVFYKERLSRWKKVAILFAAIGVLSKVILTGVFSWESALVCIGYPVYFGLRKTFKLATLSVFLLEMLILIPSGIYFVAQVDLSYSYAQNANFYLWLFLLGLVGGVALILYILCSQLIPINLLGLLGYLEPLSMLIVSFIIGESLQSNSYMLMFCLTIAIVLLIIDGVVAFKRQSI